jgi:glycosyltransferase involved in cell wall biosynthesis
VVFGDYIRFPHGMAGTNRLRLVSRALVEAGDEVRVLCLQVSERPPVVENTRLRGTCQGIDFEYTTWTTVRYESFLLRRLAEAWGWVHGLARLAQLRAGGRMDVAYVLPDARPRGHHVVHLAALKLLGVPAVWELNERPWSLGRSSLVRRRWSPLTGMAGVVSISDYLTAWARAEAERLGRSVEVMEVPIVVDVDEHTLVPYPAAGPRSVVFAGSPAYDKTIKFILAAMERVWRSMPDCRLVITGAHPSSPSARWLFAHLSGEQRVSLPGYVSREELLALYGDASALLIPLFDDVRSTARFPTKIGEYLASARPVVTTGVGEVSRYFVDGVNGIVCPPGDPERYGDRIVEVLRDPVRAAKIGLEGRRLAETTFHYSLYSQTLHDGFSRVACGC